MATSSASGSTLSTYGITYPYDTGNSGDPDSGGGDTSSFGESSFLSGLGPQAGPALANNIYGSVGASGASETPLEVQQVLGTIAGAIKTTTLDDGVWSTEDRREAAKRLSDERIMGKLDQNDRPIVSELVAAMQLGHTPEGNQALLDVANKYGQSPASRGVETLMVAALTAMEKSNAVDPQVPSGDTTTMGIPQLVQALRALADALEAFAGGSAATDPYADPDTGSSDPMTGGAPQPGQPGAAPLPGEPGAAPRPGEPGAAPRPGEPGSGTEGMHGGPTGNGMAQIVQILGLLIPLITQLIQRLSGGNAGGDPSVPGMLPSITGAEAAPIAGAEGQEGV